MRVAAKSLRGASGFRSNIGIVQEIDFQGRMSLASTAVSWAGERPIRTGVIARSSGTVDFECPNRAAKRTSRSQWNDGFETYSSPVWTAPRGQGSL
jgi:hypothetical protein